MPPSCIKSTANLPSKPSASITYTFYPPPQPGPLLLVFLNGLLLPASGWVPTISSLHALHPSPPAILTYDRYGQASSDPHPSDVAAGGPGHHHDVLGAAHDLAELLDCVAAKHGLGLQGSPPIRLVLAANSIGCALARLFAQRCCRGRPTRWRVAALLLLDSIMANSDFVCIWPDPDAASFDPRRDLAEGVTPALLRATREKYRAVFHPDVVNVEGLSRRNLAQLLPRADAPKLGGEEGEEGPYVTVVGHDPEEFARQSEESSMKTPRIFSVAYTNPCWAKYNEVLVQITGPSRRRGPLIAPNAGHFIQKDNPNFIATEINHLLSKFPTEKSS
ncbi:hypothetical protein BDY21DRAFT_346767 [Lineolata rhizophorae]|uniref:AB hydrolase-1 domain-containing protein n=1 Tax=Lineolata rhizophorae TaxID=578093 RepID=A0A6A6NWZ3_9PEZI|nr:hypothetical protein BDY21DRAFT_346767 [Lineolata rhizophorae]